ncbi:MAG: L,D-transpeptidase family protein [Cellvibrionaceae bacterium]|nr:L,D-transpeptidase family protein [Cellvibrionaceae bacterium]
MCKQSILLGVLLGALLAMTTRAAPVSSLQPAAFIDIPPSTQYALLAELVSGQLHIYQRQADGHFIPVQTMEASIGKAGYGKQREGDNKTPVGVYRITSHLTAEQLDDFYGNAAYPLNYPNVWDRLNQRTGYGIWLHAEPLGFTDKTRPLRDSNGCLVLSNNDIDALAPYLAMGITPIVMTPRLTLRSSDDIARLRQTMRARLAAWERAWESQKLQAYMDFYAADFTNFKQNWQQWRAYKTRINRAKRYIDVAVSDISIYDYPQQDNLLLVVFYQAYRSSNYQSAGWKRQLWRLQADNQWRIIYEGGG